MAGTLTSAGIDRMFKSGLFSAEITVSLHTASPPTDSNKQTGDWYSDVKVAAGNYSYSDKSGYRRVVTSIGILFGRLPDPPPTAPTHVAIKVGSTLLWYGDVTFTGYAASRLLEIPSGGIVIDIQKVGADAPA